MFKQIFSLVAISILLGLGARVVYESPTPLWGFPEPIKLLPAPAGVKEVYGAGNVESSEAFAPADAPYDITYEIAFGLYAKRKRDNIHFVDAREPDLYAAGHIPGAVNIPYEELAENIQKLEAIPKDDLIVMYCDGGDCRLSHDLAEVALSQGHRRLCVFTGGWEEWSTESDFIATSDDKE